MHQGIAVASAITAKITQLKSTMFPFSPTIFATTFYLCVNQCFLFFLSSGNSVCQFCARDSLNPSKAVKPGHTVLLDDLFQKGATNSTICPEQLQITGFSEEIIRKEYSAYLLPQAGTN